MGRGIGVVIDDTTPLNGTTIDVGARIGWVLRMARLGHARRPGLDQVAAELGEAGFTDLQTWVWQPPGVTAQLAAQVRARRP